VGQIGVKTFVQQRQSKETGAESQTNSLSFVTQNGEIGPRRSVLFIRGASGEAYPDFFRQFRSINSRKVA
jgi:hypothetical protein